MRTDATLTNTSHDTQSRGITFSPKGYRVTSSTVTAVTSPPPRSAPTNARTGLEAGEIAQAIVDNLRCLQGKLPQHATRHDWYTALAYSIRDRLLARAMSTAEEITHTHADAKLVAYLSAEFLLGPTAARAP